MSEVVPLPSFGEVFFDARGQDRVLRVTWHEGTLVLSLWRGEMCTASFRMPMDDVGRLIDTLDDGFHEAGGHFDDEDAGTGPFPSPAAAAQEGYAPPREAEYAAQAPDGYAQAPAAAYDQGQDGYAYPGYQEPAAYPEYPDYPGTGQYARPPVPTPAPAPEAYPPPPEAYPPAAAALGPNDVLVARGTPAQDRLVASSPPRQAPPAYPPAPPQPGAPEMSVDPNDPLGLGSVRPYVTDQQMYSTGERLRPEPRPEHGRERDDVPPEQWPERRGEGWEDARGW